MIRAAVLAIALVGSAPAVRADELSDLIDRYMGHWDRTHHFEGLDLRDR